MRTGELPHNARTTILYVVRSTNASAIQFLYLLPTLESHMK